MVTLLSWQHQEAQPGRLQVSGQPELCSEILIQKQSLKKKNNVDNALHASIITLKLRNISYKFEFALEYSFYITNYWIFYHYNNGLPSHLTKSFQKIN